MTIADQLARLAELGLPALAGPARDLPEASDAVVAVHPEFVPARTLAALLRRDGRPGFVVADLTDLEQFAPIADVDVPERALYLLHNVGRGDDLRNWSPNEALPEIINIGRTPLTISEGISWLLQCPQLLEPNHCFMTIGSRRPRDARTPAIWISGGTGRDGKARKGAPKVGWCWAGNRHTWLGFASARRRG